MSATEKTEMMSLRARPEEIAMLVALAEESGLTKSAVIWQLVRREHRRVFPGAKPAKKGSRVKK